MTIFLAYITRLIVIMLAFAAASIAASVFFVLVGIVPAGGGVDGDGLDALLNFASMLLLLSVAVAAFSSMLLLVPAFVLALLSEYFGWNSLLFHGVSGALLGGSATGLWQSSRTVEGEGHLVLAGTAAGIVGAAVYWLIAGRNSGLLFEKISAARNS
ncbi:MAG: hypothetical protein ACRCT6_01915 [Notoacmeibacter sp.]